MKNEKEVIDEIVELESMLFDDTCYLDEGDQNRLQTLYQILNRSLTDSEKERIITERRNQMEDLIGEIDDELLLRTFYYN